MCTVNSGIICLLAVPLSDEWPIEQVQDITIPDAQLYICFNEKSEDYLGGRVCKLINIDVRR